MQIQPTNLDELKRWQEMVAFSRTLFVNGQRRFEQWQALREKFQLTEEQCDQVYAAMRDEITREITEAKENPTQFAVRMWRMTRDDPEMPWRERITAQTEIDELFDLVKLAEQRTHWNNEKVQDAWAFYQAAVESETISKSQRLRAHKRLDLLIQGPKRDRRKRETLDRRDEQTGANKPDPNPFANWSQLVTNYKAALEADKAAGSVPPAEVGVQPSGCGRDAESGNTDPASRTPKRELQPSDDPNATDDTPDPYTDPIDNAHTINIHPAATYRPASRPLKRELHPPAPTDSSKSDSLLRILGAQPPRTASDSGFADSTDEPDPPAADARPPP